MVAQICLSLDLAVEGRGSTNTHRCRLCKTLHLESEPPSAQGHMHSRKKDRAWGEKEHPICPPATLLDAEGQEQTLKRRLEMRAFHHCSVRPMHLPLLTGMHAAISLVACFQDTIESA